MKNIIAIYLCLILLVSCNKPGAPDCFKRTGIQTEKIINPGFFNSIDLEAHLEVTVNKGNEHSVKIMGGRNTIEKINISVTSGTLVIKNLNSCNFVRGYKKSIRVEVTCPYVKYIKTSNTGNITTSNNFSQDTLVVRTEGGDCTIQGTFNEVRTSSHGAGNFYLKCKTNSLLCYSNGTNYLYGYDAEVTDFVFVESISIGQAYIRAPENGKLHYHLHKSGNLFYKGNPSEILGKIEGSGKVYKEP